MHAVVGEETSFDCHNGMQLTRYASLVIRHLSVIGYTVDFNVIVN